MRPALQSNGMCLLSHVSCVIIHLCSFIDKSQIELLGLRKAVLYIPLMTDHVLLDSAQHNTRDLDNGKQMHPMFRSFGL